MTRTTMEKGLEQVTCAVCGGNDTSIFLRGSGDISIVRCRRDGFLYINPRPARNALAESFETFVKHDDLKGFAVNRRPTLRREANAILVWKQGGVLLDVGCATGLFFAYFGAPDWKLFGADPCAGAAEYAREHCSADIFHGCLEDSAWNNGFFDVITILDSLYYFADPLAALVKANQLLKPDGILAVEIPGFAYKLFRERGPVCWLLDGTWNRLSPDNGHLYHFSRHTLGLLLGKAGFQMLQALPEEAPLLRSRALNVLNRWQFSVARFLFWVSRGHLSIAAKEFYICRKEAIAPGERQTQEVVHAAQRATADVSIAPLSADDVPRVVDLHMAHLTTRLSGEPGKRLLTEYYNQLCSGQRGCCLVCRRADDRVGAMVVLRWDDSPMIQPLVTAWPFKTPLLLAWQILCRPASSWPLIRSIWERRPVRRVLSIAGDPSPWCILHALVATPSGQGIGRRLVDVAFDEARHRGFKYMITSTYETIGAANRLYKAAGFMPLLTTVEKHHQVNWYGRSI